MARHRKEIKVITKPVEIHQTPEVPQYEKPELEKVRVITFTTIPDRVSCPHCGRLQFTVNECPSNGEIVRKCDKCHTKTAYKFNILSFGVSSTSGVF